MLALIFVLGFTNATVYGVEFSDYFPLDPASHGFKTFQWTYGETGTYSSYISGTLTVPYTSGAIEGTGIVNHLQLSTLYATNDGDEVKWLATTDEDEFDMVSCFSTDQYLTANPTAWTFSTVTDDMFLNLGIYYTVAHDLTTWELEDYEGILFDIQNVTVLFEQYSDAVIMWGLDLEHPFTELDLKGKEIDLGITLPNSTQTGEHSVTDILVYAHGIGMIACGDIVAETGELVDLAELVNINFSSPVVLLNELKQQVIDMDLHNSPKKKLLAKLNTALKKLQDGKESNDKAAVKPLTAFIDTVTDQSGNKISEEDANSLITAAQQIIDMLSSE